MRRAWSGLTRVGLASLATAVLVLNGGGLMTTAASAPRPHTQGVVRPAHAPVIADGAGAIAKGAPTGELQAAALATAERLGAHSLMAQALKSLGAAPPRRPGPALLVRLTHSLRATSRPGGGKVVGIVPAGSKYYRIPVTAWILKLSANRRHGLVPIPYTPRPRTGWIRVTGLKRSHTPYTVYADLSARRLTVRKLGRVVLRVPMAIGAPRSPTPPGRYFVTDRVPFNPRGPLGAFAFGISGIQTRLPPGWSGGNQLAIHGTNNPGSIGRSVSAGCLRVLRGPLERLKRILVLGTPVVIQP